MARPLIEVTELQKEFRVEAGMPRSLFNQLRRTLWIGAGHRRLRALSDVTFRLEHGESLGLVGNNGAGKSTLLRILSGIYRPTAGICRIDGRFTPVLELGVGMHQDLSVRENVFLYGAMIGFRRRQLHALFDEIIAFAELEEFVDARVKELSTGMRQRLTFSINAQLESDLILLDEILAVGDRTSGRSATRSSASAGSRARAWSSPRTTSAHRGAVRPLAAARPRRAARLRPDGRRARPLPRRRALEPAAAREEAGGASRRLGRGGLGASEERRARSARAPQRAPRL